MARRTKEEIQAEEKRVQNLTESLKVMLEKVNYKVFTSLRHVSQSGMSRAISCYITGDNGEIKNIDWYLVQLGLFSWDNKHGGLKVGGCGTDAGFHVVYTLSCKLYCPEKYEHDSAYKLKQTWL